MSARRCARDAAGYDASAASVYAVPRMTTGHDREHDGIPLRSIGRRHAGLVA
jgi:hypothetical protein